MSKKEKYDTERLLFRRQFVLGPRFSDEFPSWKRAMVGDTHFLTVHPDLPMTQAARARNSVTLLGYILDPENPRATDEDIVQTLLQTLDADESLDLFPKSTYGYGGRWVLIADTGSDVRLYHDAMGYRQVFYTDIRYYKELWCGSQAAILAHILHLRMDDEALNQFINTELYQNWPEVVWQGDGTPYKEIAHLLPNRYLSITSGVSHKYWPDGNLPRISLEEGVEVTSRLLVELIRAASYRYKLAFTATAGWDSRLLLAASREFGDRSYYFTLWREGIDEKDALVTSRLLPRLGLQHQVIHYPDAMDPEFEKLYMGSLTLGCTLWGRMAQGVLEHYPEGSLCIKGNASEIARVRFRLQEERAPIAQDLSRFSGFGRGPLLAENAYVNNLWNEWLDQLAQSQIYNVNVFDLYYWDHYAGNFGAQTQSEWDIIQEVFTPYNCRKLLTTMLSVDEQYRDHDEPVLYRQIAMKLWPEVLSEPVNPPPRPTTFRGRAKEFLIKNNLYQFVPGGIRSIGRKHK